MELSGGKESKCVHVCVHGGLGGGSEQKVC